MLCCVGSVADGLLADVPTASGHREISEFSDLRELSERCRGVQKVGSSVKQDDTAVAL